MMWNRTSGVEGPRIAAENRVDSVIATLVTVMKQVVLIL